MSGSADNIGTTQVVFEADTKSGDVSLRNTAEEFAKVGVAAEKAGAKVEAAGAAADRAAARTAKLQERAAAREAKQRDQQVKRWQESFAQEAQQRQSTLDLIRTHGEAGRAALLASLQEDILTRSLKEQGDAAVGSGIKMQNSIGLLDNAIRGQKTRAFADIIRGMSGSGIVMQALPIAATVAGIGILVGVVNDAVRAFKEWREAQERLDEGMLTFRTSVQEAFNGLQDKLLQAGIETDDLTGNHLDALQKKLEMIDNESMSNLLGEFQKLSEAAKTFLDQKELADQFYTPGVGSSGAKADLAKFEASYQWDITLGKSADAAALLANALMDAQHTLDIEQRISKTPYLMAPGGVAAGQLAQQVNPQWTQLSQILSRYGGRTGTRYELTSQQALVEYFRGLQRAGELNSQLTGADRHNAILEAGKKTSGTGTAAPDWRFLLQPETVPGFNQGLDRMHDAEQVGEEPKGALSMPMPMSRASQKALDSFREETVKLAEAQARASAAFGTEADRIGVATGALGLHAAALNTAARNAQEYEMQMRPLRDALNDLKANGMVLTGDAKTENLAQIVRVQQQMTEVSGRYDAQRLRDDAAIRATTAMGELRDKTLQLAQDWTDFGRIISETVTTDLNSFNATLMKELSTPASQLRGQHPWRNMAARMAEHAGTSALQYGEGTLMKLLTGKNPKAKMGTKDNPMYVRDVDANKGAGSVGSGGLLGMLNDSDTAGKLFGGRLFGPGGFFDPGVNPGVGTTSQGGNWNDGGESLGIPKLLTRGGGSSGITDGGSGVGSFFYSMGGGGGGSLFSGLSTDDTDSGITGLDGFANGGTIRSNLPVLVGEHGPEILAGAGGRNVIPNHKIGSSTTNVHIDARGATDPAATEAAAHRAMRAYYPAFKQGTIAAMKDDARRRPASMQFR